MLFPKRYKVIETSTGLRLTLPSETGWTKTDYVDIEQKDVDTLIITRKKF